MFVWEAEWTPLRYKAGVEYRNRIFQLVEISLGLQSTNPMGIVIFQSVLTIYLGVTLSALRICYTINTTFSNFLLIGLD